ncbi:SusC/RagA family TonB-linked outer membrane protein [Draconibacterium halophilum]|uniref:SusC/RagA family TonB-linked outer membrane protein n=1 Tax=Draconibacterium halophilum TaxID=2706887 RepID=A0A6C0RB38_9BACT|nr:SusC/RagA family TonB-linked outer membrane protein [Draconibacterium halophilum]QIA07299.1 SusC/RagA family TonB-linked outer membrane protein [Draconibacterium halophilum]
MKKIAIFLSILLFMGNLVAFAQTKTLTGTVTSAEDDMPIPGVSVSVKGTTLGTITNMDGGFELKAPDDASTLIFSFIGMRIQEVEIGSQTSFSVAMQSDVIGIDEVVVTALGISREKKTLPYAAQDVKAEQLNVSGDANIKNAIVGKVAGVQMVGQAGSKLGQSGKIRIRGAISLTSDSDPLYVVDGIPVGDPNVVDMNDVESVNVLKGPNATALYGQRAEYGVIMITTKKAKAGGISVEINSNTTFDKVAYLPEYQNLYGGGYDGADEWTTLDYNAGFAGNAYPEEWSIFDGRRFIYSGYADESWGPAFDGEPYTPWYAMWPESPYYGETTPYVAQPDNIKDFYDTGVTTKNSIAISGAGDGYTARLSLTNLDQNGIIPESEYKKNTISGSFDFDATDKLSVGANFNFSKSYVQGDFDDGYSNQVTGSFNSWFARNVDMDKMRELKDLQTTGGYHASWNYWGPFYSTYFGTEKAAFWFNPYWYLGEYQNERDRIRLIGDIHATYNVNENLNVKVNASTNIYNYKQFWKVPYSIEAAADPAFYNVWNSGFGNTRQMEIENNYNGMVNYANDFGDFDVDGTAGISYRTNSYDRFRANMPTGSKTQGLVLPDVYTYSNTKLPVTAQTYKYEKEVMSMYARVSLGWREMLYLDGSYRQDWSSALPEEKNGYGYPSIGSSFIFTELIEDNSILSFGKLRAGWAQVGTDLAAMRLNQVYPLSGSPYLGSPQMYTNNQLVDPAIEPAINTSMEFGFDLKFLNNRAGLTFTYFNEIREKEIIPITMSQATGKTSFLTNAGKSKRDGIELVLDGTPVQTNNFVWNIGVNFATSNPVVEELPGDLQSINAPGGNDDWGFVYVVHKLGEEWGQLRGRAIRIDEETGQQVVNAATGTFAYDTDQYLGSVLPDFTGGIFNQFTIMNLVNVSASIDFQKGGKFFSLSEMWGQYSGLLEETAGINDQGNNVRDAIDDGGGVHVVGVDTDGNSYDQYVDSYTYFSQFNSNTIASPYVHDASYMKLRDVSVSVNLPKKWLNSTFLKTATVGFVGRNLWMISLAEDNIHNWDPSEMSQTYGENAGLPGTRSYGFDVKLTF